MNGVNILSLLNTGDYNSYPSPENWLHNDDSVSSSGSSETPSSASDQDPNESSLPDSCSAFQLETPLFSMDSSKSPSLTGSPSLTRKRKSSLPHRSISRPFIRSPEYSIRSKSVANEEENEDELMIVQLNAYEQYLKNPSCLLYKPLTPQRSRTSSSVSSSEHYGSNNGAGSKNSFMGGKRSHNDNCATPGEGYQGPATNLPPMNRSAKPLPDFVVKGFSNVNGDQDLADFKIDLDDYKDTSSAPQLSWKPGAQRLSIPEDTPGYSELTPEEVRMCSTLRLVPEMYLHIKKSMLQAVYTYGPFKKRDAQLWFRIDVNKTSHLYEWFRLLSWIPSTEEEWRLRIEEKKRQRSSRAIAQL